MKENVLIKFEKILSIIFFTFVVLCFIVPLLNPELPELKGSVGVIDHPEIWADMDLLSHSIYWLGDLFCHQKSFHCFFINNTQMAFCIRDVFLFIGTTIGFIISTKLTYNWDKKWIILGLAFSPLTFYDWLFKACTGIDIIQIASATAFLTGILAVIMLHVLANLLFIRLTPNLNCD